MRVAIPVPSSIQAIYILIVLLPGFFVVAAVELLTGTREKVPLRLTIRALALSFVVYVVYSIFVESGFLPGLQVALKSGASGESQLMFPTVDIWGITALSGISLFVSVALSLAINKDWMRILRYIGLTRQSHDAQPWDGAFRLSNHWVLVKLGSGDKLVGWPKRMSSRETRHSLSLQDAHWIRDDGTMTEIGADEFLITGEIEWVQLLKIRG